MEAEGVAVASTEDVARKMRDLRAEVAKRIVGQEDIVEDVLTTILAGGHALLVGVPGLAKTLLVRSLAEAMRLSFRRIQFTPDLMPSDITGTELLEEDQTTGRRSFRFVRGPIFANIILADEINRTPPKTQAALLEAMQEHTVTAAGQTHVAAASRSSCSRRRTRSSRRGRTRCPRRSSTGSSSRSTSAIPTIDEEVTILRTTTGRIEGEIESVVGAEDLIALQVMVRDVVVAEPILRYVAELVRATRPGEPNLPERVKKYVRWGAGPRAGQALVLGAKARALLDGRVAVTPKDIQRVARPVLRHRVLVNFAAEAEGVSAEDLIADILAHVPVPQSGIRV